MVIESTLVPPSTLFVTFDRKYKLTEVHKTTDRAQKEKDRDPEWIDLLEYALAPPQR